MLKFVTNEWFAMYPFLEHNNAFPAADASANEAAPDVSVCDHLEDIMPEGHDVQGVLSLFMK